MSATVAVVLARKGHHVHTVSPGAPVTEAIAALADHNVGALVVSADGRTVEGIISERDIVRRLAALGEDGLDRPVADLMQPEVVTCSSDTSIEQVMRTMTDGRFRHIPVVDDGALTGIVSIGDVVRCRLDDLEVQTEALKGYVTGRT